MALESMLQVVLMYFKISKNVESAFFNALNSTTKKAYKDWF